MSAYEIRDAIVPEIQKQTADFICLNFANPDMVGHTGDLQAAQKPVKPWMNAVKRLSKLLSHKTILFWSLPITGTVKPWSIAMDLPTLHTPLTPFQ